MGEPATHRGIGLFRIGGIEIRIDYSWFIIFALVFFSLSAGYFPHHYPDQETLTYWLGGLLATLLFFASILIHELSHSFMARHYGIEIRAITLFLFGGMAQISEEARDAKTEFRIAIVGPFTSFALALVFWAVMRLVAQAGTGMLVVIFEYLAWINLALGIFNLLPAFPLDGGRVFRALWWWRKGSLTQATKVASDMGKGFAFALMLLGGLQIFAGALVGGIWLILIGMFLRGMAEGGYQEVLLRRYLTDTRTGEIMVEAAVSMPPDISIEEAVSDYFLRYGYHGFPVVENGRVKGVISLSTLKNVSPDRRGTTTVEDCMMQLDESLQVGPDTSLSEALGKMTRESVGRLIVMRDNQMIGLITRTGLLRFLEVKRALES